MAVSLSSVVVCATEPCRFQCAFDFGLNIGFSQKGYVASTTPENHTIGGYFYNLSCLYNINSRFTTGIGMGLESNVYAPHSLPVFATFRHRPLQKTMMRNFYYDTALGYGIGAGKNENFAPGFLWNIGAGWQKNFRKHFGLNIHVGYGLNEYRTSRCFISEHVTVPAPYRYSIYRHSIRVGVGIVI